MFNRYAPHVANLVKVYGYRSLIVTTDSDIALGALEAELPKWGLQALQIYTRDTKRIGPEIFGRVQRLEHAYGKGKDHTGPLVESWTEFYGFTVDLNLLAACDGFVGKFTSNLARIAFALMAARHQCMLPYVSLDSYYCAGGAGKSFDSKKKRKPNRHEVEMGTFPC